MKKLGYLLVLVAGIAIGGAWSVHRSANPSFPLVPEGHRHIGSAPPEGTSPIKTVWSPGIERVGSSSHTPRVWRFYQELDVSAAQEYSETYDASSTRHFSPHSTLIHRVFDHYRDSLREQVATGGFGWGHSRLHNRSYISGSYCSVPERRVYKIDVWRKGMSPDSINPIVVRIMMIPDILCAEQPAEQDIGQVSPEGAPSDKPSM